MVSSVDLGPRARRSFEGRRDTKSRRPEELYEKSSFACDFELVFGRDRLTRRCGKGHSKFELIAGGSVLLEHFTEPGGQEMLTAYHLDGSRLVLTHYCLAGNQPQMVAEKFDGASGELDFAFAGGSNIAPGAGHMHDAVFHLASNDHFDAKWDFVEAGKVKFSEEIHYTRTK